MMLNKARRQWAVPLLATALIVGLGSVVSAPARAGMGNTASTYGLLPMDVASA